MCPRSWVRYRPDGLGMNEKPKQRKTRSNRDAEADPAEVGDAQYESIEMALIAEYLAKTFPRIIATPKAKA